MRKKKTFFNKVSELGQNLRSRTNLDRDKLLYRVLPDLFSELIRRYLRVEVEGLEHIPKRGPAIVAPNHSGFLGFDAMILNHLLHHDAQRTARIMTHHLWFLSPATAIPAQKMGFVEATYNRGLELLNRKNLIVLFPEGESGNFKPSKKMYQLQNFKRGFVRLAIQTGAPIVPTLVVGAEETHINLTQLKLFKFLRGPILPLPLNILPLPAKWKVIFMEPIYLPFKQSSLDNQELIGETTEEIRELMQARLRVELKSRKSVF